MSVPRQGVEPCFAQDKEMHARKMGKSRTRARIGKSVACRRDRRGRMPSLHEAGHGLTKHLGGGVVDFRLLTGGCSGVNPYSR